MALSVHNAAPPHLSIPHIPRLQYRTTSSDHIDFAPSESVGSMSPASASFSLAVASTSPSSPGPSDLYLSPKSTTEGTKIPKSLDSVAPSVSPPSKPPSAKKKSSKQRGKLFFGFFSVKEPSQQAFDDYQRQLRKKGGTRNGRVNPVGLPGVSTAKLPPTVPKVNSKWDGVPQVLKEKGKQKQIARPPSSDRCSRSVRTSGSETSMGAMSASTRSRASSRHSSAAAMQKFSTTSLSDFYGWESGSTSSCSFPGNEIKAQSQVAPNVRKAHLLASAPPPLPPSIPEEYLGTFQPDITLTSGQPERFSSPAHGANRSSLVSSAAASPSRQLPYIQSDLPTKDVNINTLRETPTTDEVIITSTGFHILGPPASARHKSSTSPVFASEAKRVDVKDEKSRFHSDLKIKIKAPGQSPLACDTSSLDSNLDRRRTKTDISTVGEAIESKGEIMPRTKSILDGRCCSPSTLDGGQKPRKKSLMALFGK